MKIGIYKLNGKILKSTNLEKKLKKLNKEVEILYSQDYDGNDGERVLDKWIFENLMKQDDDNDNENTVQFHYFIKSDGSWIMSIHEDVSDIDPDAVKKTKEEYDEWLKSLNK